MTDGLPPFVLFAPLMLAALMTVQVTTINANTAAMVPLGHVAGSGAALLGMVPMVVGSVIGSLIDRQFDGTVTPLSAAFLVAAVLAYFSIRLATTRSGIRPVPHGRPTLAAVSPPGG